MIIIILTRRLSGPIRLSLERLDARGGKWGCHVAQLHGSSAECSVKELLTAGFSPENKSERRAPKGDFILEAFLKETTISLFYGKQKHFSFSSEILLTKATPALLPAGRPLGQGRPAELKAAYAAAPCLCCTPWAPLQLRPGQSFN